MNRDNFWIDAVTLPKIYGPGHRSLPSADAVYINFANNTGDVIDLSWIDFGGKAICYYKLNPGETAEVVTFAGHCWIARFIRNGAPALFIPDRQLVFVVTVAHTDQPTRISIIKQVSTLLDAAVEQCGELLKGRQELLFKLPLPWHVKEDLYWFILRKLFYRRTVFIFPRRYERGILLSIGRYGIWQNLGGDRREPEKR